ncbi:MAG: TetR/AcrR family transcriptional regulator [Thermomicrobiales bacterium]
MITTPNEHIEESESIRNPEPGFDSIPSTSRSQLRERIILTATRLLQNNGPDAVTTRAVAAGASVQAPTIYRLFGDKDGLLNAVAQHIFSAYIADKAERDQSDDPVADLRVGWITHLEFGLAHPGLFALMNSTGHNATSPATVSGFEILRRRVERIAVAGRLRVPVLRAVAMIHAAGTGTVLALLSMAPEDRDPGLGDAMYDAVLHSILADQITTPNDHTAANAAITLGSTLDSLTEFTLAEKGLIAEWLTRIANGDQTTNHDS